jgi:uncharacterized protein (DUF1501 family)
MTLVVVFLRGGADGLALVPPVGEDAYHSLRPTTRLAPGQGFRLDDRFVLHPDLAALAPWWEQGVLGIVPAAGIPENSRSHFVAQDWLEHGGENVAGGWLGRWLHGGPRSALGAIALGTTLPESLRGAPGAVALSDLAELARPGGEHLARRLVGLSASDPLLAAPAADVLAVHERLGRLSPSAPTGYPATPFAQDLARVAGLIHADVGLRVACVDLDGWDSHIAMESLLTPLRQTLGEGLAAFASDLGPALATTSIVVVTEFGRRCGENASLGTDHGRAGCAFVLGGGTPGGIIGAWPGLDHLEEPGDLPVATDLREVFLAVLARQGGVEAGIVFPGFQPGKTRQ